MPEEKAVEGEVIEDARTGEMVPKGAPPVIPGVLAQINISQVGMLEVEAKSLEVLEEKLNPKDVLIRPDGLVYLPWTWYANRLNKAFGVLRWALIPQGAPQMKETGNSNLVVWIHWLVIKGTPVSMAGGEMSYQPSNYTMSYGDAMEGARSNSLARNCKYMGMALELWDSAWVESWKREYAEQYTNDKNKKVWRKKGQKQAAKSEPKPQNAQNATQEAPQTAQVTDEAKVTPTPEKAAPTGLHVKDLKKAENVVKIKEGSGKDIPTVMKAINGLDQSKTYTIEEVVEKVKAG